MKVNGSLANTAGTAPINFLTEINMWASSKKICSMGRARMTSPMEINILVVSWRAKDTVKAAIFTPMEIDEENPIVVEAIRATKETMALLTEMHKLVEGKPIAVGLVATSLVAANVLVDTAVDLEEGIAWYIDLFVDAIDRIEEMDDDETVQ